MKPFDFIRAIEVAYDRTGDDDAWLGELASLVSPAIGVGSHLTAYFFDDLRQRSVRLGAAASIDTDKGREHYVRSHEIGAASGRDVRDVYECDMFTLLSRVVGKELASHSIRAAGMTGDDALGLRANDTHESGIIFTTHVPGSYRIRQRHLWTRFAAHAGAGLRLRRAPRRTSPDSAVAVLTPRGRLEHGTEEAVAAHHELASAAQDIDRARGKLRRLDPDEASALWRATVQAQWSLVDWLDHDGKRFVLVEENAVPVVGRKALTNRERQVVACAAMGHSNKLIAYDLGLSVGSVSVLLTRAARKLGVSGRVALVRAFRDGADE